MIRGRLAVAVVALTALASVSSGAFAEQRVMTSDGTVHAVAIGPWAEGGGANSTVILHTIESPDGQEQTLRVPATDDFTPERDPALAVDPVTQEPLLVWSRAAGRGADLLIARFSGGQWSQAKVVWADGGINLQSQVNCSQNLVHVMWGQDLTAGRRLRLSLDRSTLEPAMPIEELPTSGSDAVPPTGGEDPVGGAPPADAAYFSAYLPAIAPGDNGSVGVWGARDEPIPIVYYRHFDLPSDVGSARGCRAGFMRGRFVLRFAVGSTFLYTLFEDGVWSDLRQIALSDERTEADAEILLDQMLERAGAVLSE